MPDLLIATRNAHKTEEIAAMLRGICSVRDLASVPDAPDIEETGATFEENAALKANSISAHTRGWALADDSGLEVDALGGAPGVFSARFAGEPSNDAANNALLLQKLAAAPSVPRSARFRCVLALARDGSAVATFSGTVEGSIVRELRGVGGFGYDPLFIPDGHDRTFGELPAQVKNAISHRSRALSQFRAWIAAHPMAD